MADLFKRYKSVISRHLLNIFKTKELYDDSSVAAFATDQKEIGRTIEYTRALAQIYLMVLVLIIFFSMNVCACCGELSTPSNAKQNVIWMPDAPEENSSPAVLQDTELSPEQVSAKPLTPSQKEKGLKKAGKLVDAVHGTISRRIINSAAWLDSFFANERSLAEENRSYVTLRYNFFLEDSSGTSYDPGISAQLALPELQEKAHIIFTAEPDEPLSVRKAVAEDDNSSQIVMNTPKTTVNDKRRFTTALQYFLKSTEDQSFSIRSGLRFSGMEPVIFGIPRYRLLIPIDSWTFRFTQEVMYRSDTKWQETTRFDLERSLGSLFFRSTAEGDWFEDTPGYFYSLSFVLFQPLGSTNALNYKWINSFQTEPIGKLTDIVLSVRYRHNIWHNWIFFDIVPQCRFPNERDYQFTPGILLSMEAIFGRSQ